MGVLVVAVYGGDGVILDEVLHQLEKGEALGRCASVGGVSVGIETTDIGAAYGMGVVAFAMCTYLFDTAACMQTSVGVDNKMVADVAPAEAFMVAADALNGAFVIGAGGGTVDDDFGDLSHF